MRTCGKRAMQIIGLISNFQKLSWLQ